ncbi:transposable element Tcb1 transposase [Trichonephila clavipes]|nr:transposable element Tcb1 transposase [Trichonephila clavipes]
MFTDESRFALEPDDKRIRIWCKQGTRNQPQNITEHHAFRGGSIMVWAGISLGYRTNQHNFKRAVRYRDEVLEPIVRLYAAAVGSTFVLMDDNAHPHRADIVDDYLESEGTARIVWPTYSPDLNPIENLWDALGRAVFSRFPPPATHIELETALQELNYAVVDHLIESMVRKYLHQVELEHINFYTVQSIANLPTWSPKIMPTWLYHQHFALFPLNRPYNSAKAHSDLNQDSCIRHQLSVNFPSLSQIVIHCPTLPYIAISLTLSSDI